MTMLLAATVDVAYGPFYLLLAVAAVGMAATKIEWAELVWNPTTGCSRVSPGCEFCYMFADVEGRLQYNLD